VTDGKISTSNLNAKTRTLWVNLGQGIQHELVSC